MFSDDEVREFSEAFNQIGIGDAEEQKKILEFLYTYGIIAYDYLKLN